VIESGGFRELGTEGEALEKEMLEITGRSGIHFVGPNCLGTANTASGLYTQFVTLPKPYRRGSVAVFSQSGGVGLSLAERLCSSGVGISKLVSMGNKLSLDEADYLAYAAGDPETTLIYFYLEDIKRGRVFADAARQCAKPIIMHKSNISSISRGIAQSHTAAMAADDDVIDAACGECGIVRVRSVTEAINIIKGLSLPPLNGKNLAIISRSGGHAVVAADVCARCGFELPPLGQDILDECKKRARAGVIRSGNPLDLGDVFDLPFYFAVVEKALQQNNIDGVVFIHVMPMVSERAATLGLVERISALSVEFAKPVALVMEVPLDERVFIEKTTEFPFFLEPTEAVQALSVRYKRLNLRQAAPAGSKRSVTPPALEDIRAWFDAAEGKNRQPLLNEVLELLDLMGIPTAEWRSCRSVEDALEAAASLGFPVALKAVSASLLHKSERGGIALNIRDASSLRNQWRRMQGISDDLEGILVQKMIPSSRELIVGAKRDPSFGPVVLAGIGGIMVEVMKDISMRLAPIDIDTALDMFGELSGRRLLGRFRGLHEADLEAAGRILVQVSWLMHHFPRIRELDLNPVSVDDEGKGVLALDARLLLSQPGPD
jgi:acetyltransferase